MIDLTLQDIRKISDIIGDTSSGLSGADIKRTLADSGIEILDDGKRQNRNEYTIGLNKRDYLYQCLTHDLVQYHSSNMESFFLDDPIYTEPEQSVKLTLKNNIVMRSMRQADRAAAEVGNDVWNEIDDLEKKIITFISGRGRVGRIEIEKYTRKSTKTVNNRLNHLIELGLINAIGNKHDPGRVYEFSKQ